MRTLGDSGGGGGVAARDSSLCARARDGQRASRGQADGCRQAVAAVETVGNWQMQALSRCRSGLCGALRAPCATVRVSGLWELVHAVGRGRNETSGRSVGGEHDGTIG
jgi:hypothetical protein